jgi:hypothetical protein
VCADPAEAAVVLDATGEVGVAMTARREVWSEDVCRVCGEHVGWGVAIMHIGYCDEHYPPPAKEAAADGTVDDQEAGA